MPAVLAVLAEKPLAGHKSRFILVANPIQILIFRFGKSVGINKMVVACVVGRIDVDHFYLAEIAFLQNLEHFQIFTFNKDVAG